jgi:DnaJ-domain-containing protein 1
MPKDSDAHAAADSLEADAPTVANPFSTLGLPLRFPVDQSALERAWLRKAAAAHPDRAGGGEGSAHAASHDAAVLNAAKRVLADDERAANALLRVLGGPDASADKTLPDGVLAEMLEKRDELHEARSDESKRAELDAWATDRRAEHLRRLEAMFDDVLPSESAGEGEVEPAAEPERLSAIRTELNALRYIERFIEQLDPDFDHAAADL